jgi:hypothetical protein
VSQGRLAAVGLGLGLAGVLAYFVVVFRLPWLPEVRNFAVPNWLMVVAGLLLSVTALARATAGRRLFPSVLFGLNVVVTVAFAAILYAVPAVPRATGPAVGAAAPDFALADQTGKMVRAADFRGSPLLLVFYRGHW